jgi:hypothetical protein
MPAPEGRYNIVTITQAGQKWAGRWVKQGKAVCIETAYGSVTVDPGRKAPEKAAEQALAQLVSQWRAKGAG